MQADRWERIKDIFSSAAECDTGAREQLLDRCCAGDAELRAEIDSLLAAHDGSSVVDRPPVLVSAMQPRPSWIGRRLGPYRVAEEIGQGGMSEVYRAVRADHEYEKEVAVKVLRSVDSETLLRHFRTEKQILARLDHPNIARLLDAGSTEDGQPFIVMDFIRGRPIDEYCTGLHLDMRARLALFRALCDAVHYVHQHLLVHGDLKCSNILVTDDGVVKLLDFGIATLLTETQRSNFIALTPEYASPEQIEGQPTTTVSDVYSLGVVLHRLLTGALPDSSPRAPGVNAELDSIILKALQKDPAKRYSSAQQLDDDVRHFLTSFPVLAHGSNVSYVARKFVRRHKVSTAIGALLLLSLIGGVVATTWQAHVARLERARAERHSASVRKLADTLMFDVHKAIENLAGATAARQTVVASSLEYLDALSAERAGDAKLRRDLAVAYEQVGDVQGTRIGDNAGAIASYRKALAIRSELLSAEPDNQALRRQLIRNHGKLADMTFFVDDLEPALESVHRMIALAEEQLRSTAPDPADQRNLGHAYDSLGWFLCMSGEAERGMPYLQKAASIFQALIDAGDPAIRRNLAITYSKQGHVLRLASSRYVESQEMHEKSFALLAAMTQADPLNAQLRQLESYALLGIGTALALRGQPSAGFEKQMQGLTWLRTLLDADLKNDRARFDAARGLAESGETLVTLGRMEQAEQHLTESLRILAPSLGANAPQMTIERALMAFTYFQLGRLHALRGADPRLPKVQRAAQCRQSRSWFDRAAPLIDATERSRTWNLYVAGFSPQISQLLAQCS